MREHVRAPLVAVTFGLLLARVLPFELQELLLRIVGFIVLSFTSHFYATRRIALGDCFPASVSSGTFIALVHRRPTPPELTTADLETVILSGCIVEPGFLNHEREQFTLELEPGARVRVNLYLKERHEPPEFSYGQRGEFAGKNPPPSRNYRNPGDFDNVTYLARARLSFGTPRCPPASASKCFPTSRFWAAIYVLRVASLESLVSLYEGSPYDIAMMQATLIGESSGLEKVWTQDFRSTGTFHALVISGGHIAVLAGFFFLFPLAPSASSRNNGPAS